MKRIIVLMSGGLDSAVTLGIALKKHKKSEIHTLTFNYLQSNQRELKAAETIVGIYKSHGFKIVPHVVGIAFPWKGSSLLGSGKIPKVDKTNYKWTKLPSAYVPARNMVFLSYAVSLAEAIEADAIYAGFTPGYPDNSPSFVRSVNSVIRTSTKNWTEGNRKLEVIAPLAHLSKQQTIEIGTKLSVPMYASWSCFRNGIVPCKECQSCIARLIGYEKYDKAQSLPRKGGRRRIQGS